MTPEELKAREEIAAALGLLPKDERREIAHRFLKTVFPGQHHILAVIAPDPGEDTYVSSTMPPVERVRLLGELFKADSGNAVKSAGGSEAETASDLNRFAAAFADAPMEAKAEALSVIIQEVFPARHFIVASFAPMQGGQTICAASMTPEEQLPLLRKLTAEIEGKCAGSGQRN